VAWTQADLDTLDAAIIAHGKGQLTQTVTFQDRTVTFEGASLEERLALRAQIAQALAAASSTPKNYRLAATSKGA
jgi:hypothetical protein